MLSFSSGGAEAGTAAGVGFLINVTYITRGEQGYQLEDGVDISVAIHGGDEMVSVTVLHPL